MKKIDDVIKTKYSRLLERGEWKAFARRVRDIRQNTCEHCGAVNVPLHIHHTFYDDAKLPWEYDPKDMLCLCGNCHSETHAHLQNFRRFVFGKLSPREFQILNGALTVALDQYDGLTFVHALAQFVSSPSMIRRFADEWGGGAQVLKSDPKAASPIKHWKMPEPPPRKVPGDDGE